MSVNFKNDTSGGKAAICVCILFYIAQVVYKANEDDHCGKCWILFRFLYQYEDVF